MGIAFAAIMTFGSAASPASAASWNQWKLSPVVAASKMNLPSEQKLAKGDTVLRNALPLENTTARKLQTAIEDIRYDLRLPRNKYEAIKGDVNKVLAILLNDKTRLIAGLSNETELQKSDVLLESIASKMSLVVAGADRTDQAAISDAVNDALDSVTELETMMVKKFPFRIPRGLAEYPALLGRATVDVTTSKGDFSVVVDGFNAPLTAGNFVDLVQRGVYNNKSVGFTAFPAQQILMTNESDLPGSRRIPLELMVQGEELPYFGKTLDDVGLDESERKMALPFSSWGAVAMSRPADDPNGASSQFFIYLYDGDFFRARLLEGNYAVFGYVTKGKDVVPQLSTGDKIVSAKVVSGLENLQKTSK